MTAPTAEFASLVYGSEGIALDDKAEEFHEASRLYPDVAPRRLTTIVELARSPELQQTVARSSRAHDHRPGIDLPHARLGRALLRDALVARRSCSATERAPLTLSDLAAALGAAYRAIDGRRPVPSGGALYPLELYVAALDVGQVDPAVYHYQPFRHRLERIATVDREDVARALVDPDLAQSAAALVIVTGMFWRTRFKYGPRGYRFALLEAGHLGQNLVLAAAAMQVAALPLGGFYDCRLDALVGADGLEESSVYAILLGGSA